MIKIIKIASISLFTTLCAFIVLRLFQNIGNQNYTFSFVGEFERWQTLIGIPISNDFSRMQYLLSSSNTIFESGVTLANITQYIGNVCTMIATALWLPFRLALCFIRWIFV